jgi:hypothetical protein
MKLEYYMYECEKAFSYDDLIKTIKPFRMNENINELYDNLIDIFKNNDYLIKNEEDRSEIILKLFNFKGKKEDYTITLPKVESNEKNFHDLIENGYKLGVYTEKSWNCDGKDKEAFCFSINLRKIYRVVEGRDGTYTSSAGPIFGSPGSGFSLSLTVFIYASANISFNF